MTETQNIAPVTRSVQVAAPVETAFALFTSHIGSWWPLGSGHSVFGKEAVVAFEGDVLVERHRSDMAVWGEVLSWEPPHRLRLNWHPGSEIDRATELEVTFTPADGGTVVTLVHTGWENTAAPEEMARNYDKGWAYVLGWYDSMVGRAFGSGTEVQVGEWFALCHSAGPALAAGESIFGHAAFGEHVAFLQRLQDRGLLVAAGPLPNADGEGMTIVRVLPEHGATDIYELATSDDRSVADGYLTVEVKPWAVRFTG
jgi:uncharacterized protein YndB with AHSA1/START domain/uncharacterized protein YciI